MMEHKESYRQQQENELEVIQSIYGNDVCDLRDRRNTVWRPLDIVITLLPQKGSSGTHEAYAKTNLHIICPSKYPKVSPKISLEETKGLSDIQKNELLKELSELCEQKKGEVVIYDLAQIVQAYLHKHNKAPCGSFYDQMLIERNKRDEALLQQQTQRLNHEQQKIRNEVLKRKELLRQENRWHRDSRRSMSEQSPKHRPNSSGEIVDHGMDGTYPNGCELHLSSEDLYLTTVGRKIRRGCCLSHSKNGSISYSGIDSETGQLLYLTEWNIKYTQLESKCPINCKTESTKCSGHTVDEIITCIEREVMQLSHIRHKNLVAYEAVLCLRRKEGIIVYLVQDYVHGTSVNCISNSLGWTYTGVSIIAKGVLDALIYLHNKGISHSSIDDCSVFLDNSGTCRVTDFWFVSYLMYLMGAPNDNKHSGGDLPALGHLVESLLQLPNPDMFDFIEQCKSERTLTASDLLEHPFLSPDLSNGEHNTHAIVVLPEKKVTELSMRTSLIPTSRSRLQTEFEVLQWLGKGAYGDVLKVKNILDNRQYAIKRIPLHTRSRHIFKKMTREVELLSRLNHENVVRYFNSWIENGNESDLKKYGEIDEENESATASIESDNQLCVISKPDETTSDWMDSPHNNEFSSDGIEFVNSDGEVIEDDDDENDDDDDDDIDDESQANSSDKEIIRSPKYEVQIMYIQMEFCEKSTLRTAIDNDLFNNTERLWRLFREIIEGLAHIHSQGMIHRDLKPVNIFLDSRDQVKIGDFGLATTSFLALQPNHEVSLSYNRGDIGSSHTGKVGTALYVAPELMGKAAKSIYNQKVDLYSLGIIFFEMCHRPFSTGMERVETLAALRSSKVIIPAMMENDNNYKQQVKVIKWLLTWDQNKRPTAEELLASDLLPPARLEDNELQEMLRNVLANPQSKSYKHLVARCLAQQSDTILELTYQLGMVETNPKLEYVKREIVSLFERHGAIEVVTPLLSPYVKSTKNTAVRLMTHSGSVVVLPYDLRVPFIKHIAMSGINLMRRYSIGRVYREKKVFNFHPKQLYECAFDIISPYPATEGKNRLIDAELMSIAYELTNILPALKQQNLSIRLNHTSLLVAILQNHNVPQEKFNDIFVAVLDFSNRRISKFQLHSTITALLESSKRANNLLEMLLTEIPLGAPKSHYANGSSLRNLIKGHSEPSKMARAAMEEIENVVSLAQSLGVMCPISLYAGFSVGYEQAKNGGIIWQLLGEFKNKTHQGIPYMLGVGGRYDYMLSEYQKEVHNRAPTISNRAISGAGLSFALDKILSVLNMSHTEDTKTTDVVVCISGIRPNFRDITQILRAFWSSGIQCAVVQANNPEDGQDMAKDLGAIYYVVYTEDGILRVRSWINERFEEKLLNRDEIIVYITKALRPEPTESNNFQQAFSLSESNKYNRSNANLAEPTLPAVDIIYSTIEKMTASAKKRQESFLNNHMSESLVLFNKRVEVVVIVVELQPSIIRALISAIEPGKTNAKDIDNEISFVIDRFPKYKRYIKDIVDEINDIYSEKKRPHAVCLYSLKDSYYRFIL
ncbi:eIF-2-alpha kinase GCN2 [Contarinia nasturtii]|uniref:eIF-2-alpha kinase GCN2 n=1 Tax=Contarinia nasturtii TaxID=265458 RepID=UPI0012D429B0|nr:eIF-2-alpha kinase GCN2 [Contarinia nasturtii]